MEECPIGQRSAEGRLLPKGRKKSSKIDSKSNGSDECHVDIAEINES